MMKIIAKNSKSSKRISREELKKTETRNNAEYTGFELKITMKAEIIAKLENK